MDLSPLYEALFASDDEIEQGFIVALVEAFEEWASWPKSFYMSGKGGDIFSQRTFAAVGKVLRSVEEEEGLVKSNPVVVAGKSGSGCSSQELTNYEGLVTDVSSDPTKEVGPICDMGGRSGLSRANKPKSQSQTRPRPNNYPKMIPRVSRRRYANGICNESNNF